MRATFGFGGVKPVCITTIKQDASAGVCKIISGFDVLGTLTGSANSYTHSCGLLQQKYTKKSQQRKSHRVQSLEERYKLPKVISQWNRKGCL